MVKRSIRKVLVLFIIITIIVALSGIKHDNSVFQQDAVYDEVLSNLRTATGFVVEVNVQSDSVLVETTDGFLWEFSGAEDWMDGDGATVLFDVNGTNDYIFDDAILRVTYNGMSRSMT